MGGHSLVEFSRADRRARRAGVTKAGSAAVVWGGLSKTAAAIVLSPMTGFFLALMLILLVSWICVRFSPRSVDSSFRWLQFVSASLYSLGHGGNDAQKTMGIIAVLLYSQGMLGSEFYVPFWVVITCQLAMVSVRCSALAHRAHDGLEDHAADADAGLLRRDRRRDHAVRRDVSGIPVSTTHTITGSIIGSARRARSSAVRWNVASNIVVAWIITLPASAAIAAFFYVLSGWFFK